MRNLFALAFVVVTLLLGFALTACSNNDGVSSDYYENNIHNGYPGPGTKSPNQY
jgi:hypothetical protein